MSELFSFTALIESEPGGGAYVTVPIDVEQVFGKKRVKVKATIDGVPYRGSLVRMGGTCLILGVLKEIRTQIGKVAGDEVQVTVEEDLEPRVVEVPPDLQKALEGSPQAWAFFQQMAYTNQRETVKWILDARREATRAERITRAIEMLQQGKKP